MSIFEFCLEIIRREGKRFNVGINTTTASQITAATASDVNFDVAHNRCSFLYRCGAINLSFAQECFKQFLLDEKSKPLLSKWGTCPNPTVCSIGKGPALDYIALLLSCQECNILPPLFSSIKVISKYGAWRNTVNIMLDILKEKYLTCLSPFVSIGEIEVIQGDPLKEFSEKVKQPISNSDIVLMFKALNLQADGFDQIKIAKALKEFLGALKPGAIIFCIDTKPSVAVIMDQLRSFGNFLNEPTYRNTSITVEHADFYKDIFGCFPVASARGSFFVWQKTHKPQNLEMNILDEVTELVKKQLTLNNIQDNVCSSKSPEDNYSKLGDNSFGKKQITSTTNNFFTNTLCDLSKNLKPVKSNSSGNNNNPTLKGFVVESPLKNSTLAYDCVKKEDSGLFKPSNNPIFVNQAIQTDPEDFKGLESIKMIELTNKIAKLTKTISGMMQMSESDECKNDICLKDIETECMHSCPCKKELQSVENCCISCKCCEKKVFENCQNCICCSCRQQEHHSMSNQYSSCASFNGNSSCHNDSRLKFPTENNSVSVPKLVIPLNNLSGSTISQILSIIAQSNEKQ